MQMEFDRVLYNVFFCKSMADQEDCDSMMVNITYKLHFFNLIEVNNTKSENN